MAGGGRNDSRNYPYSETNKHTLSARARLPRAIARRRLASRLPRLFLPEHMKRKKSDSKQEAEAEVPETKPSCPDQIIKEPPPVQTEEGQLAFEVERILDVSTLEVPQPPSSQEATAGGSQRATRVSRALGRLWARGGLLGA